MKITVERANDPVHFIAKDELGHSIDIEGPDSIGGKNRGFRPMSLVLASLATCSVMDVIVILTKQKQQIDDVSIEVDGTRPDTYPAPFQHIKLHFLIKGKVEDKRAAAAVKLSVEKYCSVAEMLKPKVVIDYSHEIVS